jgi:hypothetical protein
MANISRSNAVEVTFEPQEIRTINVSAGGYDGRIKIESRNDVQVTLKFDSRNELKTFVEALLSAARKVNWTESYPSGYVYMNDDHAKLEQWEIIPTVAEDQPEDPPF